MRQIDRDGTRQRRTIAKLRRHSERDLQKAAGPNEVVGKGGAERITAPGGATDVSAALAAKRVIHQSDHRRRRRELIEELMAQAAP